MRKQWDVTVIGAGPAGLSAASVLGEMGVDVVLLDDGSVPGGQIYHNVTNQAAHRRYCRNTDLQKGRQLVERFSKSGAAFIPEAKVWHAETGRVIYSRLGQSREVRSQFIIVATGAQERAVPFPGWTLPGVMGAGGVDLLYKNAGILPEGPMVLAGNGPLLLLMGNHLADLGMTDITLLDTSILQPKVTAMRQLPKAMQDISTLFEGGKMLLDQVCQRVKVHRGVHAIRAIGTDHLQQVVFSMGDKTHRLPASSLLVHDGVVPRTDFSSMLRLKHHWNAVQKYWFPLCNMYGRSSVYGIYVAGDGASVHGADASALKGLLAGFDVAEKLHFMSSSEKTQHTAPVKKELVKVLKTRPFIDQFFAPNPSIFDIADDTIVCRCESVRAADIRQAVAEGCSDVNEIKLRTRTGMGNCQGRMRGANIAAIAARKLGVEEHALGMLHSQTPLRSIGMDELSIYAENYGQEEEATIPGMLSFRVQK